ncbi:peptidase inhibitor family I36 protein [Streptomyces sp. NBC_01260]|uniref:peptidase inhibitor family I36 protein n=1 Tax=unclassified Streptomyces TaxID=2593676 RepID=UPI000F94BC6F|nr:MULTISPECIES: peptidase inhibitor family I36 protein [unclassified Streptomyces]MCX4772926.1 peptidase inhibitor family I36 protein [Streptomyces sp. NBC_01285]ROQ71102.1 peptidase inhibitor family I36 [Streptomyces sp. CEV 2-1]
MRNFKRTAAVLAAAGALLAGAAGTASAGSYNGSCESAGGEICLYRYANFGGSLYDTVYSKTNYSGSTYYGTSVLIDNTISSVKNRDYINSIDVFTGQNYTGLQVHADPGLDLWDMAVFWDGATDDAISSHCFSSNAYCPS